MVKNNVLSDLITETSILGKESKFWKRVAAELKKPARIQRKVNVGKIEENAKEGLAVVVPGKVLGVGTITKKVDVVAYSFSESALVKIKKAGGKAILLTAYTKKNKAGKGVQILG